MQVREAWARGRWERDREREGPSIGPGAGVFICMLLLGLATTEKEGLVRGQPSSEGIWETPAMSPLG